MPPEEPKPDNNVTKLQVQLAAIGLIGTLGVAVISNWSTIFSPPSPAIKPTTELSHIPTPASASSASSASPTPTSVLPSNKPEDAAAFNKAIALEQATLSSDIELEASEEKLGKIVQNWQQAIQLLDRVPISNENYALVAAKRSEYENRLRYSEGLKFGILAAKLTQAAGIENNLPVAEWQNIEALWEQALMKLNAIPVSDPSYGAARPKIQKYEDNRVYAGEAKLQAPFLQGSRKAGLALIEQKKQEELAARSPENWLAIASLWKQAINLMETVNNESENYAKAQDNIQNYKAKLAYARQQAIAE